MQLDCNTLSESYEKVINSIIWNHAVVKTEDKELTWQTEPMLIKISNPAILDYIHKNSPYGVRFYDAYAEAIVEGYADGNVFEYDYHSRLFEYGETLTNQIQYIVDKLNSEETTRRAIAITWDPYLDGKKKDVPCLQNVQFWISNDLLYMSAMFRSEDMLMAYPQNVYGLVSLMKHVSNRLDIKIGQYWHYVTIPHLYYVRDANYLNPWMSNNAK